MSNGIADEVKLKLDKFYDSQSIWLSDNQNYIRKGDKREEKSCNWYEWRRR